MNEQYAAEMTKFPLLQGFTLAGTQMLMEAGEVTRYAAGEVVFNKGDESSFTLLLLSGILQVFLARPQGELELCEAGPGTILGELGVICRIPRSASLRAKNESVVLLWRANEFRKLLIRHNLLAERVLGQSLRNLIEKEHSLVDSLTSDQAAG